MLLLRRPLLLCTFLLTAVIFYSFSRAPRLSLVPSKRTARLLFQLDKHTSHSRSFKPVKKSDLDWARPKDGIVHALRHYRELISQSRELDDVEVFWRDFYE